MVANILVHVFNRIFLSFDLKFRSNEDLIRAMFDEISANETYDNSLLPSCVILRHWSTSSLFQTIVCCLTTQSHYLNQIWVLICEVLWHSSESNSTASADATIRCNEFENYLLEIELMCPYCNAFSAAVINAKLKKKMHILIFYCNINCVIQDLSDTLC